MVWVLDLAPESNSFLLLQVHDGLAYIIVALHPLHDLETKHPFSADLLGGTANDLGDILASTLDGLGRDREVNAEPVLVLVVHD